MAANIPAKVKKRLSNGLKKIQSVAQNEKTSFSVIFTNPFFS